MAFISVADELIKKGSTIIENKFITKYLPVLEPRALRTYLFALYVCQNGLNSYTPQDFAAKLGMSEDDILSCFEYLEELELASILSRSPLEIRILNADNLSGTPKKLKPEKYSAFASAVQSVITGRMISTNEFMEYYYLLDEYSFEQNALLMIISYCVNLKGNDIRYQYIKKVAKSFAEEGITTAKKVEEKLSSYTSSAPALSKIFLAVGIARKPDPDDNALYEKWTNELGFSDEAIICAAKHFKAKSSEKIDEALKELYTNRKFDVREIEDYSKAKNSLYACATEIAKSLGVYMQNASPYVENYVCVWRDCGFEGDTLKIIADYCFMQGKNSFEAMNDFVQSLYEDGIITEKAVSERLTAIAADDKTIKNILKTCGMTRKIIDPDRQYLKRWKSWNFSDEMLFKAAETAQGKSNPLAYMNAVLSSWKSQGITAPEGVAQSGEAFGGESKKAIIERHYYDLRAEAAKRAEKMQAKAMKDEQYSLARKKLNTLSIQLAFAEVSDEQLAKKISDEIALLEKQADERLTALGISKADLLPRYKCEKCKDTGYDSHGRQCECLQKFIKINKL